MARLRYFPPVPEGEGFEIKDFYFLTEIEQEIEDYLNDEADAYTNDETAMDRLTHLEFEMDKVTDSEVLMDKVADKEMPMDKVTDSEVAMDKVTDKEMPMDKVMADVMPRTKMLLSPYIVDTVWSKEMASEKFWKAGEPEPPHTFDRSEMTLENYEGGYLLRFTRINNIEDEDDWEINVDFTDVTTLRVKVRADTFGDHTERMEATILIDGDEILNLDGSNYTLEERVLHVEGITGTKTLTLRAEGTHFGDAGDNYEVEFAQIRLEE